MIEEEIQESIPQEKPVLGYWRIRGLVQPCRFLLAYVGVDYDNKYYEISETGSREEWLNVKFSLGLELPNLPYWLDETNGIKLTQSRAILRHIARWKDQSLLGTNAAEQRSIDMLENHIFDFWTALINLCYRYTVEDNESFMETLPKQLEVISNFYKGKQWAVGENLTYVDFVVYESLYQHNVFAPGCIDDHAPLLDFLDRFQNLPAIRNYIESSRNYVAGPLYTRLAKHYI